MQKREKMVVRMSGVVRVPVMVERWWMVARRSWARRSPGMLALRPASRAAVVSAAACRACAWRRLVTRMVSCVLSPLSAFACFLSCCSRVSWPSPVCAEKGMMSVAR